MFISPDEITQAFDAEGYVCSRETATVVHIALQLKKPLLVEGPAGVGKTELAKALSGSQGFQLIRMQCYEGLDETKALYEWDYAKQLLYTQLLKEKISETLEHSGSLSDAVEKIGLQESAFFSNRFLVPRPILKSIFSNQPTVLLIDEVDKAEPEFEAFLLEVLSDFQVSIPEIGTLKARHIPQVILTSNNSRVLSDGLKRRCLYQFMDFPSPEREAEILQRKIPDLGEALLKQITAAVHAIRDLDLKKYPSIGETLDWARALLLLQTHELNPRVVHESLSALIKYQQDQTLVIRDMDKVLSPQI